MYYVIYTTSGLENKTEDYIKRKIPDGLYVRCFHPVRHMRKKFKGIWKDFYENLIPGYVFLESNDIMGFYAEIRKNKAHIRLLGKDPESSCHSFYELTPEETDWLWKITGLYGKMNGNGESSKNDFPICELSEVEFREGDHVIVSGPLKNVEGSIKKINFHKRRAEVEVEFLGRKTTIFMGIDLLTRKE